MKNTTQKKLIINASPMIKNTIRNSMIEEFEKNSKKSWSFFSPKILAGTLSLLLVVVSVVGVSLHKNPLTPQSVSAQALAALDEEQSRGNWQYLKTKEFISYEDGTSYTSFTEGWNNVEFSFSNGADMSSMDSIPNSSYKTTLEDGRILSEYVYKDGKSYERNTRDVQKEVYGYDPYAPMSEDSSNSYMPEGFSEAGLTTDAFATLSMKEIDDKLVSAGQKPFFSPMYKSTDFPAYAMKPEELEALYTDTDNAPDQATLDSLYGTQDNMVISNTVVLPDGTELSGQEAEDYNQKQMESFQTIDSLRSGQTSKKREILEKLSKDNNVVIETGIKWEGKDAISIDVSSQFDKSIGQMTNKLYLDSKTYRIVGEEYSFDTTADESMSSFVEMKIPKTVKVVYLEEFYTNIEPKISIEGLIPSEELYNSITSSTN